MATVTDEPSKKATTRLRIAICGGGIGGLTLATVLHKYSSDLAIDVYEAAPQFTKIGAGISVWNRTWRIIQILGLDRTLGKMVVNPPEETPRPGFTFRKADQSENSYNFYEMIVPYGSFTLHRADLLKALLDNLPTNFRAHLSKRMVSYSSDGDTVKLHFADRTEAVADIVIGADGLNSVTREMTYRRLAEAAGTSDAEIAAMLRQHIRPSWSGTFAYRAMISPEKLLASYPDHQATKRAMIYCGKNKHVVSYPISQGRLINLIGFVTVTGGEDEQLEGPAVVDVQTEEVLNHFECWEPEVQAQFNCVEKPSRWAISHVRKLPHYVSGRVAILGDAAHAMTTHLGAGAGQAIEDALMLGRLLSHSAVNNSNVETALKVYDAVRRPFANGIVEKSREAGSLYEFNEPEFNESAYTQENLNKLAEKIYDKWSWQWTLKVEDDWARAKEILEESIYEGLPTSKL